MKGEKTLNISGSRSLETITEGLSEIQDALLSDLRTRRSIRVTFRYLAYPQLRL
jgi:hypothetical protein